MMQWLGTRETVSMGIDRLPLLVGGLLVAGALAFGSAIAVAQTDETKNGATSELPQMPQSRGPTRSFKLTPLPPEPPRMEELEGGEDEPPSAHTCPDRGNNLELII